MSSPFFTSPGNATPIAVKSRSPPLARPLSPAARVALALRSLFDALDGIDALTDQLANVTTSLDKLDSVQPKLLNLIPPQIASQLTNRDLIMTNYATGHYDAQNGPATIVQDLERTGLTRQGKTRRGGSWN